MTYAEFLANKEQMTSALAVAIHDALVAMGGDIKGIEWFSVTAKEYEAKPAGDDK